MTASIRQRQHLARAQVNRWEGKSLPSLFPEIDPSLLSSLRGRYQLIKRRCNNPTPKDAPYYKDRGIQCRFSSSVEFVSYVLTLPGLDIAKQIDREDNDGHYEKGNLRFVTCSDNNKNKRRKSK